jgi:hypothetical protein
VFLEDKVSVSVRLVVCGSLFPIKNIRAWLIRFNCCFRSLYTIPQQSPVASRGFFPCPVVSRLATLHASTPAILILDNQIDLPRFSFLSVCKPTLPAPKAFNFFLPFFSHAFSFWTYYSSLCCPLYSVQRTSVTDPFVAEQNTQYLHHRYSFSKSHYRYYYCHCRCSPSRPQKRAFQSELRSFAWLRHRVRLKKIL